MKANIIQIHPADNVAVAIVPIRRGESLIGPGSEGLAAVSDIPRHHKVALKAIAPETPIVKYGETIALAKTVIKPGEWVHTHNIIA
jgi:altronate dehydratase